MQKLPLTLTENQVRKLIKGLPIQLAKDQLMKSEHYLMLHPETHKKVIAAKTKGRGVRITLTHPEIMASGSGFMDILRKIGKAAMWVKDKVIDTPFYQQTVKPEIRSLVDAGKTAAAAVLPAPISNIANAGIDKIGQVTNAFGLPLGVIDTTIKPKRITKKQAEKMLSATSITEPTPRAKPKPRAKKVGGSFVIN